MIAIVPAAESVEITKIICPECRKRVPLVGLQNRSKVEGLVFKCVRCKSLWLVKTE